MTDRECDGPTPLLLGNFYYAHYRVDQAVDAWKSAGDRCPAVVWRNLAVAYFNDKHDHAEARNAFDRAVAADPTNSRLRFEHDQLRRHLGDSPADRLAELLRHPGLIRRSNDLAAVVCELYCLTGRPLDAMRILSAHPFPARIGNRLNVRARLTTGDRQLIEAARPFADGTGLHDELNYWLNEPRACAADTGRASISAMTSEPCEDQARFESAFFYALNAARCGRSQDCRVVAGQLLTGASDLLGRRAESVDPVFFGDGRARQDVRASVLAAMADVLLGRRAKAIELLDEVARVDPADMTALAVRRAICRNDPTDGVHPCDHEGANETQRHPK